MKTHKQVKNAEQYNKKDIVNDSFIEDYPKYVDRLETKGWTREMITLTELLSSIVAINKLKAGNDGTVVDIKCPAGLIVTIPGLDSPPNEHNAETIRHIEMIRPIEIKLADHNGNEIDPDTHIEIIKHRLLKKDKQIEQMLYRDISMTNYSESPNLFKDYVSLYRFRKGIEVKGEDSLRLHVTNPNIDIDIVKFNFGIDLWTQTE